MGNIRFTTKANGGISVKKAERISGNSLGAHIYTGVGQRKSQLICVDLISGGVLDEMELPGIASDVRVLGLWEDCIYTMTFEYKSKRYYDQVKNVIYSCIALD